MPGLELAASIPPAGGEASAEALASKRSAAAILADDTACVLAGLGCLLLSAVVDEGLEEAFAKPLASATTLATDGSTAALIAAGTQGVLAVLGCLLLCAGADEGLEEAFASSLALASASILALN